ncbi:MAG: efflux RND transporter permease subunit [Deltaproteobacteria bacterium]|nr:efflux RND transporter permease subunit [Deltaproteobacteria bacterium]
MQAIVRGLLGNRLVVLLLTVLAVGYGLAVAPFGWDLGLPRDPVPVDAIPDIGENQQIVFTAWPGRSPQDVEDQLTYPLTVALLGIPGVRTIRSSSAFGFSSVNVIFEDDVEFYWSRSRLLEKLASLPPGTLPADARPQLGPDATALGQVYWYTLEGRDAEGKPAPGFSLDELRSVQDFYVRPALNAAAGISEVASIGGFVREYQIDVDPDAMRAHRVRLGEVIAAVQRSNRDVGARTIEVNQVEYVIRGVGFLKDGSDIEKAVIRAADGVAIRVRDVAKVHAGPATRRGMLDKGGAEAVGGVAVVRYGANPMAAIAALKTKIREIASGLPERVLPDGRHSKLTIVPFYDRTQLIDETIATLEDALIDEVLITLVVILVMLLHVRASVLIAGLLPVAVLLTFALMRQLGVDANIVALSGIAIAIGTMVDMGIVVTENITTQIENDPGRSRVAVIRDATAEVGGAVLTAVGTTVVSFLPVFGLQAAEGKLFSPLAYTKTFALLMAVVVALALLPVLALFFFPQAPAWLRPRLAKLPGFGARWPMPLRLAVSLVLGLLASYALTLHWMPLGKAEPVATSFAFVLLCVGGLLGGFWVFQYVYPRLLALTLRFKAAFLGVPLLVVLLGLSVWLGADRVFGWLPESASAGVRARFPGLSEEFMPKLDEGSYLWMPTIMPHGAISAAIDVVGQMDRAIAAIPEVKSAVGKIGRAESALDPAPVSMVETIVVLEPEFTTLADGTRKRNWRPEIRRQEDIWEAIVAAAQVPGATSAPELQPIAGRIVMLQTGMRAPMGIKVKAPDLETLGAFSLQLEAALKEVPQVQPAAVLADRVIGKPYLEIRIDRDAIGRYGARIEDVQQVIEVAIGGKPVTTTVEGRERYPVRIRYQRELRDNIEALGRILVPTPVGAQIPLDDLADIEYVRGPQMIRSEDTFLTAYVVFDGRKGLAEVDVVDAARAHIDALVQGGKLVVPPGVTWTFAGNYENKIRSDARLAILVPVALLLVFILLYLQFRSVMTTLFVFSGVAVAMGGGFLMLWAWGQPGFLDVELFGQNLRQVFGVHPINLSVAIWVGFIALIGIATDDGVVMATFLDQRFRAAPPRSREEIRAAVQGAGQRRIRACLMTTATTILALLPVLTSTGRGSDIMIPMAIPAFGGMAFELLTLFVVPVLYCGWAELRLAVIGPSAAQPVVVEPAATEERP